MCAANGFKSRLGKSEVPDLTFRNPILNRSRHVFNRHVWIDTMLIKQIDVVSLEPSQRRVRDFFDVLGPAVSAEPRALARRIEFESEFRRDHNLVAHR